jgi:lysine 2,3-aminomutase
MSLFQLDMTLPVLDPPARRSNATLLEQLSEWETCEVPHLKPPVSDDSLEHRQLLRGEFWRRIPAYETIDTETFLDHSWQGRNSATNPTRLFRAIGELVSAKFREDVEAGYRQAPMAMRLSPYLISLMNWADPYACPLRKQFLPVDDQICEDHPLLDLDSLHEQEDSPVPGLTHRYRDKALFLPLNTCPVYCRFCTRSYSVGPNTDEVEKAALRVDYSRWRQAFAYLASRPEIEDVVVSGGDSYNLRADWIEAIGMTLLGIPHIRRIRFATKGLAVMPQKVLSDTDWVDAITRVVEHGRKMRKEVVIHTHFNHPSEITWISREATGLLSERGITVRNQAVLMRGVNDDVKTMTTLVHRLGYVNVQPYYVYLCDMVKGVEDLRTSLAVAERLEKSVRGGTAGFNTPTFVCDTPGGGGKRCVHSYEYYNRQTGIAVYTAPLVKPGQFFVYCDPLHSLADLVRERWQDERERQVMIDEALREARRQLSV